MNLTLYGDDSKGLIRLDPRTKLLIFFASGMMSLNSYSDITMLVYALTLCIVLALCGKPWTALKAGLLFVLVVCFRMVMENSPGGAPAVVLILSALSTIFLFSFPVIMSILLLVQTTRISHFLSAFQTMHLPVKLIVPIAVFFRFLPTVADEWAGIRKAMAFRGISLSFRSIVRHPAKTIEYILIPLLFSSVSVMEEMAAAAMARGMDIDHQRTSYEEVKLTAADWFVILIFLGMIALSVFIGNQAKGALV